MSKKQRNMKNAEKGFFVLFLLFLVWVFFPVVIPLTVAIVWIAAVVITACYIANSLWPLL